MRVVREVVVPTELRQSTELLSKTHAPVHGPDKVKFEYTFSQIGKSSKGKLTIEATFVARALHLTAFRAKLLFRTKDVMRKNSKTKKNWSSCECPGRRAFYWYLENKTRPPAERVPLASPTIVFGGHSFSVALEAALDTEVMLFTVRVSLNTDAPVVKVNPFVDIDVVQQLLCQMNEVLENNVFIPETLQD